MLSRSTSFNNGEGDKDFYPPPPRQAPYSEYYPPSPKPTSKTYSSSDNYSPLTYPPSPKPTSNQYPPPRRTPYSDYYSPPSPKPTSKTYSSSWVDPTPYSGPKSSSDLYPPPRRTPYSDYYSPPSPKPTSNQYPPSNLYPPPRHTPYSDYYSPPSPKPTSKTYSSSWVDPTPYTGPNSSLDYYSPPTYPPSPIPTSETYSDYYSSTPIPYSPSTPLRRRQSTVYTPTCLRCDAKTVSTEEDFCSKKCKNWVKQNAPCLLKLSETSEKYNKIGMQFLLGWKHPDKKSPEISSIHAICCSGFMVNRYNTYRDKVEKKHQLEGQVSPEDNSKMSAGNERLRFHGTGTQCLIGISDDGVVCDDSECSTCCIIRKGYKLKFIKKSNGFKRFGNGIYFSATSSKSDDYNFGSQKSFNGAKYKTMLLNKVVVGNGRQLIFNNDKLNKPPHGYNSVLGEPNLMGNLNYDEVVVYKEKACIPQYLIVYKLQKLSNFEKWNIAFVYSLEFPHRPLCADKHSKIKGIFNWRQGRKSPRA
ncbi:14076_t:CDS:2 [Entrophospora sp. SA101]|nr:14076_t:CDS:2 [Entrophospora sp. SA101]